VRVYKEINLPVFLRRINISKRAQRVAIYFEHTAISVYPTKSLGLAFCKRKSTLQLCDANFMAQGVDSDMVTRAEAEIAKSQNPHVTAEGIVIHAQGQAPRQSSNPSESSLGEYYHGKYNCSSKTAADNWRPAERPLASFPTIFGPKMPPTRPMKNGTPSKNPQMCSRFVLVVLKQTPEQIVAAAESHLPQPVARANVSWPLNVPQALGIRSISNHM